MLRQSGMDLSSSSNMYIQRQIKRIDDILKHLEAWTESLTPERDWNFQTMGLYSFINWVAKRKILDLEKYPTYQKFLEQFKDIYGIKETEMVL